MQNHFKMLNTEESLNPVYNRPKRKSAVMSPCNLGNAWSNSSDTSRRCDITEYVSNPINKTIKQNFQTPLPKIYNLHPLPRITSPSYSLDLMYELNRPYRITLNPGIRSLSKLKWHRFIPRTEGCMIQQTPCYVSPEVIVVYLDGSRIIRAKPPTTPLPLNH